VGHDPAQARELSRGLRRLRLERVARYGEADVARLLGNAGIVRNRAENRSGLEAAACGCYAADRKVYTEALHRPQPSDNQAKRGAKSRRR
jgi:3-methyladenine DNA glycosylase Tag